MTTLTGKVYGKNYRIAPEGAKPREQGAIAAMFMAQFFDDLFMVEQQEYKGSLPLIKYKDGWDDDAVAKVCNVIVASVAGTRKESIGHLKAATNMSKDDAYQELSDRVTALEAGVANLHRKTAGLKEHSGTPSG